MGNIPLASSPQELIRYNGTGRLFSAAVSSANIGAEAGEIKGLSLSVKPTVSDLKTSRNASRVTVLRGVDSRDASIKYGALEQSLDTMLQALQAASSTQAVVAAGGIYQAAPTFADDIYIDLGKTDVLVTKVTGTITGTLAVGDVLLGDSQEGGTGKIAYKGAGLVELINVSGVLTDDTKLEKDATNYITIASVETVRDVVVTSAAGTARRVLGTDYLLDAQYGYLLKKREGAIVAGDLASFDYAATTINTIHGMSGGIVERKLTFVSDKNDQGPRQRWTIWRASITMDGDFALMGEKEAVITMTGSAMYDTSKPAGQEYFRYEQFS